MEKENLGLGDSVSFVLRGKDGKVKDVGRVTDKKEVRVNMDDLRKKLTEKPHLKGALELILSDKDGKIKDRRFFPNLVVNAGFAAVAGLILADVTVNDFDEIAIGTGAVAPAAGDTALGAEITTGGGSRLTGANVTGTRVTTTVTDDTAQLVGTFNFTASFAVTESGVFNDPTTGDMLARQTFSVINVANGDSLQVTWKIQVS